MLSQHRYITRAFEKRNIHENAVSMPDGITRLYDEEEFEYERKRENSSVQSTRATGAYSRIVNKTASHPVFVERKLSNIFGIFL